MSAVREALVHGLVDRLRTLLLAMDRRDRLETSHAFVGWLEREREAGRLPEAARETLLRAIGRAADPINFGILARLDPLTPVELPDLMADLELGRVAVSERIHDLVQTGLAVREMVNDQVRGTDLGRGLVELVETVATEGGKRLAAELAARTPAGGRLG